MEPEAESEIGAKLVLPQIEHIGVVAPDTEALLEAMKKTLGINKYTELRPNYTNKRYRGRPEDFETEIYFGYTGSTKFEVLKPVRGRTAFHDFYESNGKGLHHVSYIIDDLQAWTTAYGKLGLEPIYSGERPGRRWAYFDNGFFVIELVQITEE